MLLAVLLTLLLIVTLWRFDGGNILHSARQIPLWLGLLLAGLQTISQLLVNTLWHQIAKLTHTSISFRQMLYVNCQGAVVDAITPGVKFGGEVTRAVQISRMANCSGEQAAAVVALQKLFSLSSLFFIILFAAGFLIGEIFSLSSLSSLQMRSLQFLFYGILLSLLALFICILLAPHSILAYLQPRKISRFAWARRARNFLITFLEHLAAIRKNTKKLVTLLLLSFLIWLMYPVKLYLLTMPFAPDASIVHIGAAGFTAYMVAMLPIFPGGLGGFEGTLSGLLAALGFAISDAIVITVLFRFITFWLVMLASVGFVAVYNFGRLHNE